MTCPSCSRGIAIEEDGRLPPWCRSCGASLSRASVPPASGPVVAAAPGPMAIPQPTAPKAQTPAAFHACVPQILQHERLVAYRFYVVGSELLVFRAGFGSIQNSQFVPQTRVSRVISGIGHGASMLKAGQVDWELQRLQEAESLETLDGSTEAGLREAAQTTIGATIITADQLSRVRIEAAGTWFALTRGFRCAAILKLGLADLGTLALPSLTDARRAVEGFTQMIGSDLEVNLPWGARRS